MCVCKIIRKKRNAHTIDVSTEVPGAPGIPEPLEVTDNSVTLHWKKPDFDGYSPIVEYILEYREKTESS